MSSLKASIRVEVVFWAAIGSLGFLLTGGSAEEGLEVGSTSEIVRNDDWPRLLWGDRVPIHSAGSHDLESLPGIGPVLASRMVAARRAGSCWGTLGDLEEVPGIGPRTVEGLKPFAFAGCNP